MTVSAPEANWRTVELFGGALSAQIPERFSDVSDFRPVPDHQEVDLRKAAGSSSYKAGVQYHS